MEWVCIGFIVFANYCYDSFWFYPLCVLALATAILI